MFKVRHEKTGNVFTVYGTRLDERTNKTELLFNTHCEYYIWYWEEADDFNPII